MAGPSVRKLLLSKGTVPLLLERLSDSQYEVLEESMGALRLVGLEQKHHGL